jgi:hypothetical protein
MIPRAGRGRRPEGGVSHRNAPSGERGSASASLSSLLVLLPPSSVRVWVPRSSWRVAIRYVEHFNMLKLTVEPFRDYLHAALSAIVELACLGVASRLVRDCSAFTSKWRLDAVITLWSLGACAPQSSVLVVVSPSPCVSSCRCQACGVELVHLRAMSLGALAETQAGQAPIIAPVISKEMASWQRLLCCIWSSPRCHMLCWQYATILPWCIPQFMFILYSSASIMSYSQGLEHKCLAWLTTCVELAIQYLGFSRWFFIVWSPCV